MNIKFKKYQRSDGSTYFHAVLVRSVRHPVTRQSQHIYIAKIQTVDEKDLTGAVTRLGFWHRLERVMSELRLTETEKDGARRSASRKIVAPWEIA